VTLQTDVVVIGGGIAGVSAAAALASTHSVQLLEQEGVLAFHTTGRSAATYYGNLAADAIRPLTRASKDLLFDPPDPFQGPLVARRGLLTVARSDQVQALDELAASAARYGTPASLLDAEAAVELHPLLRRGYLTAALWEPDAWDIDVAALRQGFVRAAKSRGAVITTGAPVRALERVGECWRVTSDAVEVEAPVVVNAAGAWGDEIATLAGIPRVGLRPLRRTAFMVPGDTAHAELPFVVDANEDFYFRPDGPQFLCSPAEEEPEAPGDPRPREEDVALAIERINAATNLAIRTVRSQWTGLRTFSPDRAMVIGFEPARSGFFWLVGQGGTGIQTAPAVAELAASLVRGDDLPAALATAGVEVAALSPDRYRTSGRGETSSRTR
jgi:D-arginine dehydrogenase